MGNRRRGNLVLMRIFFGGYAWLLATAAGALEKDVVVSVYQGPCNDGDSDANLVREK
jgi:hypothetical protein